MYILAYVALLSDQIEDAAKRRRVSTDYIFHGYHVCRQAFCFIHGISDKRLKALKTHYHNNGLVSRIHGNTRRVPHNVTDTKTVQHLKTFIWNYGNINGLVLPGRVPGYKDDDVVLLSSSHNKRHIFDIYKEKSVTYNLFCQLWKTCYPYIVTMKPRTDLCFQCQKKTCRC